MCCDTLMKGPFLFHLFVSRVMKLLVFISSMMHFVLKTFLIKGGILFNKNCV